MVFFVLFVAAGLCAYAAQRCFAGARRVTGVARLQWQYYGWFLLAGAALLAALGLIGRSPGAAIAAGTLGAAAGVAGLVLRARAARGGS